MALCNLSTHPIVADPSRARLGRFTKKEVKRRSFMHEALREMDISRLVCGQHVRMRPMLNRCICTRSRKLRGMITTGYMQQLESGDIEGVMMQLNGTYTSTPFLLLVKVYLLIPVRTTSLDRSHSWYGRNSPSFSEVARIDSYLRW